MQERPPLYRCQACERKGRDTLGVRPELLCPQSQNLRPIEGWTTRLLLLAYSPLMPPWRPPHARQMDQKHAIEDLFAAELPLTTLQATL